jgi:hypothetical protein
MNALEKYLKKIGVKHFHELNEEEKATYRTWEETLNGRKITDDEVVSFFNTELEDTINKLVSKKYNEEDDRFLKVKLDFLRKVKNFLKMPEYEKKIVEQGINRLLQ